MAARVLLVHPSPLIFSEIFLRLEPLGVECVAAALEAAGYDVRLIDLQVLTRQDLRATLASWRPQAVGFSVNDLAREVKELLPGTPTFVGGHSASFVAPEMIAHADGAIDCVIRGEGESAAL